MDFVDFLATDGLEIRRSGSSMFVACCPFHNERTPSFTIWPDHAHCYGCGWHGGPLKYVMERRGCDREGALEVIRGRGFAAPMRILKDEARTSPDKPELPSLYPLNEDGIRALAKLRCLSPAGIRLACKAGVLFGARIWRQQYQAWCVTDSSGNVAQFRRFDGKTLEFRGREIKAWTKGSPSWPVGASNLREAKTPNVVLVEGGPDLLAAFCLLITPLKIGHRFVSPDFTPVTILGSSNKIGAAALEIFDRKRVRIMRHDDEAGVKAAEKWTDQLVAAGASVATCCFSRLESQKQALAAVLDFDF